MVARIVLAVAIVVVAASVGVGASTSGPPVVGQAQTTPTVGDEPGPLGEQVSAVMQANAAQAESSVENGMWVASFANTSNESDQRRLVDRRAGAINGSLADLLAERRALQSEFRNGTIDRMEFLARLSAVVGRLTALDEGIEDARQRGQAVGVDVSRLDELRSVASELGGQEVSRLARNLTGGAGPPVVGAVGAGQRGPNDATNRSNRSGDSGVAVDIGNQSGRDDEIDGLPDNETATVTPTEDA